MSYKIGIVTYDELALPADYLLDNYRLQQALRQRGAEALIFSWTNGRIDPTAFDALVIRSCWDYHRKPQAFEAWLAAAESDGQPRLINPTAVLLWNYRKERYLPELVAALAQQATPLGSVVPSAYYSRREAFVGDGRLFRSAAGKSLAQILAELEAEDTAVWAGQDVVIKPTLSAGGENTLCVLRSGQRRATAVDVLELAEAETAVDGLFNDPTWSGVIVQPRMEGIEQGEYSLVYIGGQLSHVVHKVVTAGDFKNRVDAQRMGLDVAALPSGMRSFAEQVLGVAQAFFPTTPIAYARVDLLPGPDGRPVLLECELLEPHLQFGRAAEPFLADRQAPTVAEIEQGEQAVATAVGRFADVILQQTARLRGATS